LIFLGLRVIRRLSQKLKGFTVTSLRIVPSSRPRDRIAARRPLMAFVTPQPGNPKCGHIRIGALTLACALGRSGIGVMKREGDGRTPRAAMRLLGGFCRASRWPLPMRAPWLTVLGEEDALSLGWCDAPAHATYNRPVRLPFAASHETVARTDALYDCVLILDWNIAPRARNRGSAIFLHLARAGYQPTEGCIAVSRKDMARLIKVLNAGDTFRVG
jgi:L,D-peptidoglycan transpeptidase YkuD (ErfK/YbiS/YcfS/YnhG family)